MELTNLLYAGEHSDNDPSAQPPNTFRDGLNGNLIAHGQNKFSYESVKGNSLSFTLPIHSESKPPIIIGWIGFREYLVIITACDDTTTRKPGEILVVTANNDGTASVSPRYYHHLMGCSIAYPIAHDQIVAKDENGLTNRIYWTDNNSPMRTINLLDKKLTTTYTGAGDLTVGKKYMVLGVANSSTIQHNAISYGPGNSFYPNGNIFTAVNTNYTVTGGTPRVIEYISLESLDVVPQFTPGNVDFLGFGKGAQLMGQYQYVYQLQSGSTRTQWSPLSLPVDLVSNREVTELSSNYAEEVAYTVGNNSGKSIKMSIGSIDCATYDRIRVAFVYSKNPGVYTDPIVFLDEGLAPSAAEISAGIATFSFEHAGNEPNFETLDLDDITAVAVQMDQVKTITASKNILFAGGIANPRDPEFTLSNVTATAVPYLLPSDVAGYPTYTSSPSTYAVFGHVRSKEAAVGVTYIMPNQWYEVVTNCTYNAVAYTAGQYFLGVLGVTSMSVVGRVVAVIRMQKYTSPATLTAGNYRNIRIENDFLDFKGAAVSHYLRSYWRGETYRFGIVFFGRQGQPTFVKFLKDKVMPQQYATTDPDTGAAIQPRLCEYDNTTFHATLRSLGVSFSGIDFQTVATAYGVALADLNTVIKGFSIVRLPREAQIQSQGMLVANVLDLTTSQIRLMSENDLNNDAYFGFGGRMNNSYMFYSPDDLGVLDGRPSRQVGDYIKLVDRYEFHATHDNVDIGTTIGQNRYTKWLTQNGTVYGSADMYDKGAENKISWAAKIEHNAVNVSLPGSGLAYNFTNDSKNSSGKSSTGPDGVMLVNAVAETGATANGFGYWAGGTQHFKVVNYIRPRLTALYGGTSDSVKATHKYIFCGHYQPLDTAFMTYMTGTSDATPASPGATKNAGIVNNIEVFGGDCFVSMFGFGRNILNPSGGSQMSNCCVIPIESNYNENWRGWNNTLFPGILEQATFNRNRAFDTTYAPQGLGSNAEESWSNENVYTQDESEYFLPARPIGFVSPANNAFNDDSAGIALVRHSLEKEDGEIIDSWRQWLTNNYKRADSQYFNITNIRAKSSRLYYWQNKGVGYMPIMERQLTGSALGDAIQLGVGGVIDRQDEIDFYYGNQHQMSLMESEDAFVWFDFRRKAVVRLGFGGGKENVSIVKGKDAFFENQFTEVEDAPSPSIFDFDGSPYQGRGIVSYYDPRFKTGFMVFKYDKYNGGFPIPRDFTITFNKTLDAFMGQVSFTPSHMISFNGHFLMVKNIRQAIYASFTYAFGDEVLDDSTSGADRYQNYICILGFTTGGSPTKPRADATHWLLTSRVNECYVGWRGNICKFFGIVYPFHVTMVLKTPDLTKFTADCVEVISNDTPVTDVYVTNSQQSGSDTDITTTNRNYRFIDGSWFQNLPLDTRSARLSDTWVQVKLRVKNYSGTAITTSANLVKRVFGIKAQIRKKR